METRNINQSNIKAGQDVAGGDIIKDNLYVHQSLNFYEAAKLLPSSLSAIINVLGKHLVLSDLDTQTVFTPEEKIEHNNVISHAHIIRYYFPLTGKLSVAYDECDAQGTNITAMALGNIKLTYLQVRGEFLSRNNTRPVLEVVRDFADEIFVQVEKRLLAVVKKSSNINQPFEIIHLSMQVIMIDAFVKCQILEEPPRNATS